ncbi:MAG: hypothetical protein KF729_37185 [Sandaracinaceae bacterium]|nr:hypothetical protein [Sandaracinaceae bacterium]
MKLGLVLGSSLLLAFGCDDGNGSMDDGGGTGMDGGATDGGGTGTDSGSETDGAAPMTDGGDPGTDGGTPMAGCAAEAMAFCARFEECNAQGFRAAFENQTICRRVVAAACESPPPAVPHVNGLVDEAACEAMRVGSCDGFFAVAGPPTPAACRSLPGDITTTDPNSCFTNLQCGILTTPMGRMARGYCRPLMSGGMLVYGAAECPRGSCIITQPSVTTDRNFSQCNPAQQGVQQLCNVFEGEHCTMEYDEDSGMTDMNRCRAVQYGTAGAPCFPGTDRQCASGFACDSQAKRCMAVLAEGAACIPTRDLCDTRRGLSCRNIDGADVCATAVVFVNIGAQCGNVDGMSRMRLCSAYARCDTMATPNTCVALRALDETCTLSPDNCEPGLACSETTDTCQVPTPGSACP